MSKRRVLWLIVLSLAIFLVAVYVIVERSTVRLTRLVDGFTRGDKFHAVLSSIQHDYVDSVNADSLASRAITLLVQQLDPHSEYFTPKQLEEVAEPLRGDFDGIGVTYNMATDTVIVQSVIAGGPSERAGILMGDRFLSVDGHNIAGVKVGTDSVMHLLRGVRGTKVVVGVRRVGLADTLAIEIVRDRIPIHSIEAAYMADSLTGVIRLSRFAQTTPQEFKEAVIKLVEQGMVRLVFDLRRNGGGFLEAACYIAQQFLQDGQLIVYTEGRARPRQDIVVQGEGPLRNIPLVVLVDEFSASSSEIVAGAMQDNDRALIVGRRTFGKGLVQEQRMLPDGSGLRLTVARYYTPSGRCIQKPYKLGEGEKYSAEWLERWERGEFLHSDSVHQDTLQRYSTLSGRPVYGGGGIMPDVFVPLDTAGYSPFYKAVNNKGITIRFAQRYVDAHREQLARYADWRELNRHLKSLPLLTLFDQFLQQEKVSERTLSHGKSDSLIEIQLRALIARGVLDNAAYYPIIQELDVELQKALSLVAQPKDLLLQSGRVSAAQ
ncbi:MAG: S41 family peptidase [Bacteroides sp.]